MNRTISIAVYIVGVLVLAWLLFALSNGVRKVSAMCFYEPDPIRLSSDPLYDPLPTGSRNFDQIEARGFPFIYQREEINGCTDKAGDEVNDTAKFVANIAVWTGVGALFGLFFSRATLAAFGGSDRKKK